MPKIIDTTCYSAMERDILSQVVSDKEVPISTLRNLRDKAKEYDDRMYYTIASAMYDSAYKRLEKAKANGNTDEDDVPSYTEKQQELIENTDAFMSARGASLAALHKRAIKRGDEAVYERTVKRLAELKEQAIENNRRRARERARSIKHNKEILWSKPHPGGYTDYQKKIIRGEIPYEQVLSRVLKSIKARADHMGDTEISELMERLCRERNTTQRKKQIVQRNMRSKRRRAYNASEQYVCNDPEMKDIIKSVDDGKRQSFTDMENKIFADCKMKLHT